MPEQENIAPLGDVSNAQPRSRLAGGVGGGLKRPGNSMAPEDRDRNTKAPHLSMRPGSQVPRTASTMSTAATGLNGRRQSEYLNRRESTVFSRSESSTSHPGRVKPSVTFTQAPAKNRPKLQRGRTVPRNIDDECRVTTEANMQERIQTLEKYVETQVPMSKTVERYEKEVNELRIRLAAAEAKLEYADRELTQKTSELHEAKTELQTNQLAMQNENLGVRHEVMLHQRKAEESESLLREVQRKYQDLKDKKDEADKQLHFSKMDLETKHSECKRLAEEHAADKRRLESAETAIRGLKLEVSQKQQLVTKAEAFKEELRLDVEKLRDQISNLKSENGSHELQSKQLKNELNACRTQLLETQNKVEQQANREAELVEKAQQLEQSLSGLEQENDGQMQKITSNADEVARLREENRRQYEELEAAKRKIREQVDVIRDTLLQVQAEKEKSQGLKKQAREDQKIRRSLHNQVMELKGNIRVFCRVRPLLGNERGGSKEETFRMKEDQKIITVPPPGSRSEGHLEFKYDFVFGPNAQQKDVFVEISQLVQSALDGYRVCIFAYGQTGSGKTHTMIGGRNENNLGMIPRSVQQVFETAGRMAKDKWTFTFRVSFIEIYNETCRDLLVRSNKDMSLDVKIHPKTKQVDVPNLTVEDVHNTETILELLERANQNRATAATEANERSSRSHSVFQLHIQGTQRSTGQMLNGALNLVDLAGSERLNQSKATGDRLKETQHINKSLSSLADVITALANKAKHIPYRNSKLTTLLSDSLGGESKTLMFVNVSPVESSYNESLCSLRFATRVNQCHIGTAKRSARLDTKH